MQVGDVVLTQIIDILVEMAVLRDETIILGAERHAEIILNGRNGKENEEICGITRKKCGEIPD